MCVSSCVGRVVETGRGRDRCWLCRRNARRSCVQLPRGMCNEWAWQLGGAVNENAVSRKQRMRENWQQLVNRARGG